MTLISACGKLILVQLSMTYVLKGLLRVRSLVTMSLFTVYFIFKELIVNLFLSLVLGPFTNSEVLVSRKPTCDFENP